VGGGNSAGQAAVFLSRTVARVHMLIRGEGLAATMSSYLVDRIAASPKITLHTRSEITALEGGHALDRVTWTRRDTGESQTHAIGNVFVMIGAAPNTEWLGGCLELDHGGFIKTGGSTSPYATSRPGVFASATCGQARSSEWRRASARARSSCRPSIAT
jgi:thioredoxin reductase (NADPH)